MKNKKETKFLPWGFRYLDEREAIIENDYFWSDDKQERVKIKYDAVTSNWVKEHVNRLSGIAVD